MNDPSEEIPTQELRDLLAAAIAANDVAATKELLTTCPQLANADLRHPSHRDVFPHGHPLHQACRHNHEELAVVLLDHGSHVDAPGPDPEDRPEHGTPLHFAAAEYRNYRLANLLLDRGATPNSYPNCDKSTIERMFYEARRSGMSDEVVRRAYAKFLPDHDKLTSQSLVDLVGLDADDSIRLFARMVDLGAQPPFCALVREGFDELLLEIVTFSSDKDGTPHDHPNSTVIQNIAGAARWYGYPRLVQRLMAHPSYRYSYDSAISTITVAIGSHNRDGDYGDYREIILMQLDALRSHGDLTRAQQDPAFKPLYQLATDFTWHENYGYRAEIAKPECYIDLAELLVSWGFEDIEYRDPQTDDSPLSAAVKRGHHPGISTYIGWLLQKGANLRQSDPENVNPIEIARKKGLDNIRMLLEGQ